MGLDDARDRLWPAHGQVERGERSPLADRVIDGAQHEGVDRPRRHRRRIERRRIAERGLCGRQDPEIDQPQLAQKFRRVRRAQHR